MKNRSPSGLMHRGDKYRMWQRDVLARGRNKCSVCGVKENLTADHIQPAITHPELFFDVSNGRVLCDNCRVKDMLEGWQKHRFKV